MPITDTQTENAVFQAHDITKTYAMGEVKVHALRGVDLSLYQGEFVVLLGPSGSGKSTLINMFTGIDHPTEGEVVVAVVGLPPPPPAVVVVIEPSAVVV